MSTITGTGALPGSKVRVLICAGTDVATRSTLNQQSVNVDRSGNWAAQVQPAPTASGTYVEVQQPRSSGGDVIYDFTLPDDQGGAVATLATSNAQAVTGRSDSSAPLYGLLSLTSSDTNNAMPAEEIALIGANAEGTIADGPFTIASNSDVVGVKVTAPAFSSGSLVLNKVEVSASNSAGTSKLVLDVVGTPITLTTGQVLTVDFTSATVKETLGSDLAWNGTDKSIKSTAGGEFYVEAVAIFTPTNLVG